MASGDADVFDVQVGKLGAPHGVKGLMRFFSYTEDPHDVFTYPLRLPQTSSEITIRCESVVKNAFIVRIEGIETREAAQLLTGSVLCTQRSAFSEAEENSWYVADIIGATLYDASGDILGEISAVHNFGGGDIIETLAANDSRNMYPFSEDFVDTVDVSAKRVVLKEFAVQEDVN